MVNAFLARWARPSSAESVSLPPNARMVDAYSPHGGRVQFFIRQFTESYLPRLKRFAAPFAPYRAAFIAVLWIAVLGFVLRRVVKAIIRISRGSRRDTSSKIRSVGDPPPSSNNQDNSPTVRRPLVPIDTHFTTLLERFASEEIVADRESSEGR